MFKLHKFADLKFDGAYDKLVSFEIDNGQHGIALEVTVEDMNMVELFSHTYLTKEQALELAHKIIEVLK